MNVHSLIALLLGTSQMTNMCTMCVIHSYSKFFSNKTVEKRDSI